MHAHEILSLIAVEWSAKAEAGQDWRGVFR
jgi:hypothetical protein